MADSHQTPVASARRICLAREDAATEGASRRKSGLSVCLVDVISHMHRKAARQTSHFLLGRGRGQAVAVPYGGVRAVYG